MREEIDPELMPYVRPLREAIGMMGIAVILIPVMLILVCSGPDMLPNLLTALRHKHLLLPEGLILIIPAIAIIALRITRGYTEQRWYRLTRLLKRIPEKMHGRLLVEYSVGSERCWGWVYFSPNSKPRPLSTGRVIRVQASSATQDRSMKGYYIKLHPVDAEEPVVNIPLLAPPKAWKDEPIDEIVEVYSENATDGPLLFRTSKGLLIRE